LVAAAAVREIVFGVDAFDAANRVVGVAGRDAFSRLARRVAVRGRRLALGVALAAMLGVRLDVDAL
jgi:hypothetical protein